MVADTANEAAFAPSITTTKVLKVPAAAVANGTMDSASKRNPSENGGQQNGEISISASGGGGGEQLLVVAAAKKVRDAEGRRRRRKQKKKSKDGTTVATTAAGKREDPGVDNDSDKEDVAAVELAEKVEVEYVMEKPDFEDEGGHMNPLIHDFLRIFEKFAVAEEMFPVAKDEDSKAEKAAQDEVPKKKKLEDDSDEDDEDDEDETEKEKGLSNKKKKLQRRMKIAELKQKCLKPDVVEVWDATAADPRLLVFLKGYRNTVPVPRHWCQKRKFLQGKRGIEKQPFQLPDFIAATGIEKIRQAYIEKEDSKKLKQKQREKMQPKMGKMDIDYQVLHDAFFKYQTKPKLTHHGDLYHEGKEFEVKLREMKPGVLSQELKDALGMPEGAPPPWLINMQRYGPPPSYPQLKIPGLNAPIPEGASFGYHAGGWGKPPVDEYGRPLYGDVFGVQQPEPLFYEVWNRASILGNSGFKDAVEG